MAVLVRPMPPVVVAVTELRAFGVAWTKNKNLTRTPPYSSTLLSKEFDKALGKSLAAFLGNIPVVDGKANRLLPPVPDCVEVGPVTVAGGVRVQNFDVGYRPDGVRFVADSKSLNDSKSVGKNFWNMVNDLGTEATTAHLRYPTSVVAFVVAIPEPCLTPRRTDVFTNALLGLTGRVDAGGPAHKAEAVAFVVWDPATGETVPGTPGVDSPLRLENLSRQIEAAYVDRFGSSPPHRPKA